MADIDEESGEIKENEPELEAEELLQELDEVEVEEDIEEDLVVGQVNVEEGDDEEEDCRSSATPTQDDNASPIVGESGSLAHQPLTYGLVASLATPVDINPILEPVEEDTPFDSGPLVDADAIVDVSDGDLDEDDGGGGGDENDPGNEAAVDLPESGEIGRERRLSNASNLSLVSNGSLPALNTADKSKGEKSQIEEDDISSLSDFSSAGSERLQSKSDLEDGELLGAAKDNAGQESKKRTRLDSERSRTNRSSGGELGGQRKVRSRSQDRFSHDRKSSSRASKVENADDVSGDDDNNKDRKKSRRRKKSQDRKNERSGSRNRNERRLSGRRSVGDLSDEDLLDNSPRPTMPRSRAMLRRGELPRYDVRNVILKKRESRKRKKGSVSLSRSRSRSRSWSGDDRRSRSRNKSRSTSWNRRLSSRSRERRKSFRKRSGSGDRNRPPHLHNRGSRSRSRYRSRSGSFSPSNRRHSSPIGTGAASRRNNSKRDRTKGRWRGNSPAVRRRSFSRSPSIILDDRFSRSVSPLSPPPPHMTRKGRRGRSVTPPQPRKKLKDGKTLKNKLGDKSSKTNKKKSTLTTKRVGKTKKSKHLNADKDVIVEKTVTKSTNRKKKNRRLNVVGGTSRLDADLSLINTHVSSEIADKEVYASGDKIMVSVNFRSSNRNVATSPKRSKNKNVATRDLASAKPVCVIDVMQSPYRIIEDSPKEVVDVFSDDEESKKKSGGPSNNVNNVGNKNQQKTSKQRPTPPTENATHKTPSPKETPEKQQQLLQQQQQQQQQLSQQQQQQQDQYESGDLIIHTGHKGPCTPPPFGEMMIDLTRGPQTPSDPPDDSYDPCNPTESPDNSWENQGGAQSDNELNQSSDSSIHNDSNTNNGGGGGGKDETSNGGFNSLLSTAAKAIPFLFEDGVGGATTNGGGGGSGGQGASNSADNNGHDNDKMDLPIDMDMDSPSSPQSSDMSDIFEPPLNTPLTNKKISKTLKVLHSRGNHKKGSKASAGKLVHMKVVDDKLRIIDDVPSSAVEMAVKEKFLKKVQRQERAVEEIKMVLKPHYNRKKIDKDAYKEILRKCVPKVCHSKNGDINPLKIQKLVKGYVKKYSYAKRKTNQRTF